MVSSRIGFRARKIRLQENEWSPPEVNRTCDAEPTRSKEEMEKEAAIADMGCKNLGVILSETSDLATNYSIDQSNVTDHPGVSGEVEDGPRRTNKEAGKRKRKLRSRAAVSAPVVTLSVVAPLVATEIERAEEGLESIAPTTATSLFEPGAIADAISHLKKCDPKLRAVIEMQELPRFPKVAGAFSSLVRSIVYQKIATKAAAAVLKRLVNLCGGDALVTPSTILELPAPELRNIGISLRKADYLHDLARNFTAGDLTDASISMMEDATLMSTLTAVEGIGTWSVHMLMMFCLHRPDVLPVGDLAVRKGFQKLYNLSSLPSPIEMEMLSVSWRPYRSLGSWYMWRLISPNAPVATSQEVS